jgi:hypothetical protein
MAIGRRVVGLLSRVVRGRLRPRERKLPDYRPEIQILRRHVVAVLDALEQFDAPRLLVFGAGHDSKLWCNENRAGTTVFIEDVPRWAKRARSETHGRVVLVKYDTVRAQAQELLDRPERLVLDLPGDLAAQRFDVIVVDAPKGFADDRPGRMQSIYMSSVLSHARSHVFVDDIGRRVERLYADRYLKPRFGEPVILEGRQGFAHFHRR